VVFQLGSTLLDACVLSVLSQGKTYGYALTQEMKRIFDLSESSLYPVLRRLQKEKYLTTFDRPFQGRNRRYYAITPQGEEKLAEYRQEWNQYRSNVDQVLLGGLPDERK
jgi:PadR family transcriptional regulator PadR